MNTNQLAPVFLDDQPVSLQDARPKVSAILAAVGKPDATQVKWLKSSSDTTGKTLRPEEVVDRTAQPTQAIYLSSGAKAGMGASQGGQAGGKREGAGREASGGNPSGGFRQEAARQGSQSSQPGKQPTAEESWSKPSTGGEPSGRREGAMGGKAGRTSEESGETEDTSARDAPDALDKPSA